MNKFLSVLTSTVCATSAFAGSITYVAPEVAAIEEPARMGGSGAWLIPLIILAVIALAVSKKPAATPVPTPTPLLPPGPTPIFI